MLNEVTKISRDGKEIFLIGTAHVSRESVDLVREVIEEENPDIVAVELDKQRYDSLLNKKKWDETEIHKVIRTGRIYLFLLQLLLTNFQRKIGDELGVKPGSEMLKAIELAREEDIKIALVDRDIRITLKRAFKKMSLREKFKLFLGFFSGILEEEEINEEILERLKDKDIVTEMVEELSREVPSIKGVLIDERDRYIANRIINLEGEKIVAVVGAGHVDGIKKFIESKNGKKGIEDLEEIPKSGNWLRYIGYLIPVIFLSIVGWGFYTNGAELTIEMLYKWFLINGSLSALGVILALGHPLSVITAFLAAPFTSLNPTLAAGWFAGLTETWVRKPRVKDFNGLFRLNRVRDYWENGVTRILLVIVFANIGSSIGTFIALPYLALLL
ncbi:MAG: conjugal transfer protein TraB [Candidatus Altiarchaeales archaeon ex4484_43]|nr:MAG: conjugal transfer protein TraB [Candidatus Altiarchaeales archaeon ex4484_43]